MIKTSGQRIEPILAGIALSIVAGAMVVRSGQPEALVFLGALALLTYCIIAFDPPQLAYLAIVPMLFLPATIEALHPITLLYFTAAAISVLAALVVRDRSLNWIWVAMFAVPTVSALANSRTPVELIRGITPLIGLVAATWLLLMVGRESPRALWRLIEWILILAIPIALLAIFQRATGTWPLLDDYARNTSANAFGRSTGVFGHPIVYGLFSAAVIVMAWFQRGRLWVFAIFAGAIGLLLSGARSAWLGLLVAAIWLGIQRLVSGGPRIDVGRLIAGVLIVLTAIISVAVLLPQAKDSVVSLVGERLSGTVAQQSTEARQVRSSLAFNAIDESPLTLVLGHGPGSSERFWQHFGDLRDGGAKTFDNSYLTVAYDYGLLGLAVMLTLILTVIFSAGDLSGRTLMVLLASSFFYFEWGGWPTTAALIAIAIATTKVGLKSPQLAPQPADRASG